MKTTFRILIALTMAAAACGAQAQDWPNKPVRVVVPFAAGGSTDVAARLVAEYLSRAFGQQDYVENRTGANGVIGIEAVAKSDPDGYTLLVAPDAIASNPHVYKVNYALKDLTPVVQLSRQPIVLAAHPSLGVNTMAELIALARKQSGIRYGTGSGVGSAQHMVVQWFAQLAGVELEQVPYRGGGQAINDLIAGHIKLGSLGSTPLIPFYKAGTLRLLAQSTQARSPSLPDVPTFEEAGVSGLVLEQWLGIFAPAHTPAAITMRLNDEIGRALSDPMVRKGLSDAAQEPVGGSAEEFTRFVEATSAQFAGLVKELNIKSE